MRVLDIAFLGTLAVAAGLSARAAAEEFQMQEVPSLPQVAAGTLAPHTIVFTDHRKDELFDPVTGLIHFADWERSRSAQKQLLSLYPSYEEPMIAVADDAGKTRKRRLHVYVAEDREPERERAFAERVA